MRLYETGFLIAPNIPEEDAEGLVQQMAEIVSQKKGKMVRIERWGKRRTAYAVKKFNEAVYVFFHYEGDPEVPAELARRFRQMDNVLRYLTLVKETQQNIRKKKKAGGRRAKDAAFEEQPAEAAPTAAAPAPAPAAPEAPAAKTGEEA
jgi:small subunit ribosomal protein S6